MSLDSVIRAGHYAPMSTLRLRPLEQGDEAVFVKAHEALATEAFTFGIGYQSGLEWTRYLAWLEAVRVGDGPAERVPATFLVADVDGVIVGRTSIRHRLDEFLAREGGHIGYAVLAEFRCRGYASEILRRSLVIARSKGIDRALLTCDDDNVASATVIERCGGVFESMVEGSNSGTAKRRYWIE
jgi:predicted acetyltransferase